MTPTSNRVPRTRLINGLRFAWVELRRRPVPTLIAFLAAFLPGTNLWLVGGTGQRLFDAQQAKLEATLPTEVTLVPPPGVGEGLRVTPEFLAELQRSPLVARAYPKIQLQLELELNGRMVPIEGRDVDDPAHGPGRRVAGRAFVQHHGREVMVSADLFQRLGGRWTREGPSPTRLVLYAGRSVAGEPQSARLDLAVVGLIRDQREPDLLEVPLGLALDLERWFSGGDVPGLPWSPRPVVLADEWVRATVFARDLAAVEPLVTHARGVLGFQTEDGLAQQLALRELGRTLTTVVLLLVAASVLVGAVAVLGTQIQKVRAGRREIALLRAMGVPTRGVLGIHALQGLIVGLSALFCALVVQLAFGSQVGAWVSAAFGTRPVSVGLGSPLLALAVAVVTVGGSLVGALLPAAWITFRAPLTSALRG
jgi:FtsX-like permease family